MSPRESDDEPELESGVDFVEFFARMKRAGEEHAQVVAQRPNSEQVADAFQQFGELLYQWGEASRRIGTARLVEDPDEKWSWLPHFDSVAHGDFGAFEPSVESFCGGGQRQSFHWLDTNPTRNPAHWGLDFIQRCFYTVVEGVTAVGALVATGQHLKAPLILTRSVVEAAATGCFVMDVSVDREERLRRILNLHMAQAKEALLETASSEGDVSDRQAELDEMMLFAQHCGFTLKRYQPTGWSPPTIAASSQQSSSSARAIVEEVLPGLGSSIWRNLSAVAHGREPHLITSDFVLPHLIEEWQRTEAVAWHGIAALVTVRELCVRIESYLGWEFAEMSELVDVLVQLCFVAGGMADAQIREGLGLPPIEPWTL